jgi:hypothetical protein
MQDFLPYKKLLVAACAAAALLFAGCKKEDNNPPAGEAPVILVGGSDVFEDTLKMTGGAEALIPFTVEGDAGILSMSKLDGGIVYYNGLVLNNAAVDLQSPGGQLRLKALAPGVHSFFVRAENEGGLSGTALVEVTAVENLRPEAALAVEQVDEAAPYHVRISAAESFDPDERWGGGIAAYRFTLDGVYTLETAPNRASIDYIYPEPGDYTVRLQVQDNDGAWSEEVSTVVEVR